ncbi:glycosyl transferase group 1 [Rhizobium sp. CF080]|uniref:glycosyltransferase n=1 Tax=Rhizobium sp. (strain CF080) TaxID=1144310 RepID=UPI0002715E4D|nr:glycosyltransferase [Rhizobium sp. CF080]EUB99544.1 glycosyl transferase group 1 [Rhizobium sp. CF080]
MRPTEAFAINGRFLSQNGTGVQRYASNVVTAIASLVVEGHEVPIVAPTGTRDPNLKPMRLVQAGRFRGHLWEQFELPARWRGRLLNLCNTAPAVKANQIVCIHDANIFAAPESYSRAFRTFYASLQPLLVRRSIRIATVSHASARQIARHLPIAPEEIAVLGNGHEHALQWQAALAKAAPRVVDAIRSRGRQYVLALGSRARHKNLELLVKLAPSLDDQDIDIVVAGGEEAIFTGSRFEAGSNFHLLGRVSDDDLACLLQNALCLVFPSLSEGFGLPILEAMTLGCPVVSSNCASMPEVCGNAALMASPFDPSMWLAHIRALKESSSLADDLRGGGLEQARNFSWSKTASGYLELLERPFSKLATHSAGETGIPRSAVVVATRGRPDVATATVRHLLSSQTVCPDTLILSCSDMSDAGDLRFDARVTIVLGPAGLTAQRNTALASLPQGTEIVIFFDDDFVAHENWIAAAARIFREECRVVGFTGHVVADGIKGPGIPFGVARDLLAQAPSPNRKWLEPHSPYGCNMAFRVAAIGEVRFDERLVLYGWLEDRDFATILAKVGGRFVKCAEAFGVHMGVKGGRVSGERLGYSQIVNPFYMLRKGSMTVSQVADQVLRNVTSNVGRFAWPEPFIDRRGRVKGNLLAITDILRGRLEPERAALLPPARSFGHLLKGKVE